MTNAEAILRLKDHFAIHNDGRPTPHLDEAARKAYYALETIDRLERAKKKIARKMICNTCYEAETCGQGELGDWCCEYDVILKTIEITLAAIIGEENGK